MAYFKSELTIDDKYRGEVDVPVEVMAHVREEQDRYATGDSPVELFVELESVICTDSREFLYGTELLPRLSMHDKEYLKDKVAFEFEPEGVRYDG